jgi:hypothetical protein
MAKHTCNGPNARTEAPTFLVAPSEAAPLSVSDASTGSRLNA